MVKQITTLRIEKGILESIKKRAECEGKTQSEFIRERLQAEPLVLDKLNQILCEVKKDGKRKQKE
ncbi:MAG TPA: hypothetical protein P5277_01265 [Candidatus Paceibacterota bacterium]|nr:hypothetical protein [Candidatus Paceibacterota bacterium]